MSEPETEYDRPRKMAQLGRRQYEGIGPVTNDGMPIILRSVNNRLPLASPSTSLSIFFKLCIYSRTLQEVQEPHQHEWYKRLYQTIHKQKNGGKCLPLVLELKHCKIWSQFLFLSKVPLSCLLQCFSSVCACQSSYSSNLFLNFSLNVFFQKTTSITQLSPTHPIAFTKWIQTISWYATSVPEVILTILLLYTISS